MTEPVVKEWFRFADQAEAIAAIYQFFPDAIIEEDGVYKDIKRAGQTYAINVVGPIRDKTDEDENGVQTVTHPGDSRYHVQVRALTPNAKAAVETAWELHGIAPPDHPLCPRLM